MLVKVTIKKIGSSDTITREPKNLLIDLSRLGFQIVFASNIAKICKDATIYK